MELDMFKATLTEAVSFFEGERRKNPISEGRRVTEQMKKVAYSCDNLARSFDASRKSQKIAMPDWKAIPPCF
jgi:hypothetical protein